jgi:hypothetical protein
LIRVDLLMRLNTVCEYFANVLWNFGRLAHIHGRSLKLACSISERQVAETTTHFGLLEGSQEEPALSFFAGTTSAAETVDVRVALAGETDLNDVGYFGEVHTAGCYVRGEEDTRFSVAEVICGTGTLLLGELGMDFETAETGEGSVALEAAAQLVEDRGGECDLGSAIEVDDSLEGAVVTSLSALVLLEDEFIEGGHGVLETGEVDKLLGDTRMCRFFILVDALGEVEPGTHGLADQVDDVAGDGGGEHEVLAFDFRWVGEEVLDLVDLLRKSIVHQAIGFVHDQRAEFGRLDARVVVRKDIVESSGCADHQMASFALCLLKHGSLLCTSNCNLHHDAGTRDHLLSLNGDLFRQFSCGRDNNGPDIVRFRALVSFSLLAEGRVGLNNSLYSRDEKTERFTCTGLCLRNTTAD